MEIETFYATRERAAMYEERLLDIQAFPSCPPQTAPTSPPWRCTAPKRAVPSLRFRSVCSENCLSFAAIAPACDCAAAQPLPRRTAVPLGACAECE